MIIEDSKYKEFELLISSVQKKPEILCRILHCGTGDKLNNKQDSKPLSYDEYCLRLKRFLEYFTEITDLGTGYTDKDEKTYLSKNWEMFCDKIEAHNSKLCQKCFRYSVEPHKDRFGDFKVFRCPIGTWIISVPVFYNRDYLGNVFFGQFLYTSDLPETTYFNTLIEHYNLDKKAFLKTLNVIPRISKAHEEVLTKLFKLFLKYLTEI